jgi:hypothetical protein
MPLTFNGTNVTSIVFNGSTVTTVIFNGTTVFTSVAYEWVVLHQGTDWGGYDPNDLWDIIYVDFVANGYPLNSTGAIQALNENWGAASAGDLGLYFGVYDTYNDTYYVLEAQQI